MDSETRNVCEVMRMRTRERYDATARALHDSVSRLFVDAVPLELGPSREQHRVVREQLRSLDRLAERLDVLEQLLVPIQP